MPGSSPHVHHLLSRLAGLLLIWLAFSHVSTLAALWKAAASWALQQAEGLLKWLATAEPGGVDTGWVPVTALALPWAHADTRLLPE